MKPQDARIPMSMPTRAKNLNMAELVAQDTAHHLHPFTDHKSFHAEGGTRFTSRPTWVNLTGANASLPRDLAEAAGWLAGVDEARPWIREAFELMERRFWSAADGLYADEVGRLMDPGVVRRTLRYFDEFYALLDDPRASRRDIIDRCAGSQ